MTGQFIAAKQNEPEQVKRLAAKKQLYLNENRLNGSQMLLAVVTAITGPTVQHFIAGSEPYVIIFSGIVGICDVLIFENFRGRWQRTAAKIQEQFDCAVLQLPWHKLKTNSEPSIETTTEHCQKFYNDQVERAQLINWYPPVVQELPLRPARIICQRENCLYDARLREAYVFDIHICLYLLSTSTLVIGLTLNHNLVESLAGMVAPLIPAFTIGLREIKQNKEALESSKHLYEYSEEVWEQALNNSVSDDVLDASSRFLQDEIFDNRRRSPVIFDWYYKWHRKRNEAVLAESAEELVKKYKQKHP